MPRYLPIQGTHDWRGSLDPTTQWWHPSSPFARFMGRNGFNQIGSEDPFLWTTDLDGVSFWRRQRRHLDWQHGGWSLDHYIRPPLVQSADDIVPYDDRNIICHSHGLGVVLYAAGVYRLRIKTLISVCSPVRDDLMEIGKAAREQIEFWLHISTDHTDVMQLLGNLCDGRIKMARKHPLADLNDYVPGIGHSGILRDPVYFNLWRDLNWLGILAGERPPEPEHASAPSGSAQ